jgi:hypothetical protein
VKDGVLLETVDWAQQHFGSLHSGGPVRRRDLLRAVRRGLVRSVGLTEVCDGDGWLIPGRKPREGFVLTEAGRIRAGMVGGKELHALGAAAQEGDRVRTPEGDAQ